MDEDSVRFIHWSQIDRYCDIIVSQINEDDWRPDAVLGLLRGGGVPGIVISHLLDVPFYGLNVSSVKDRNYKVVYDQYLRTNRKVLVIDDINDTGKTLLHFQKANDRGDDNIRYATLIDNMGSSFHKISYTAETIDKNEDDRWQVFPWENYRD